MANPTGFGTIDLTGDAAHQASADAAIRPYFPQPIDQDVTPTITFESPIPLTAAGKAIDLGSHAAPRLVDWNGDGGLDLLVATGDGQLWLFRRATPTNGPEFLPGERLMAGGKQIRVGTGNTCAYFADIDGDGKPDLIVAGNDRRVRYYANTGSRTEPAFECPRIIPGAEGEFVLPESVDGRVEFADWDQDGVLDLLTGGFDGIITWYRNTGTPNSPAFGEPGVRLKLRGSTLREPHNVHPRVCDFNHDGKPDLAFGINWGYFKILVNTDGPGATNFTTEITLQDAAGKQLNLRELIEDDSIPDFADLTGNGVIDLISGGKNGKLFFLPGVSHIRCLEQIDALMEAHQHHLGRALEADATLRQTLFGLHRNMRRVTVSLLMQNDRDTVRDWYLDHIARYSQYLRRRRFDQSAEAYVAYLAGQVWVNLFEFMPDAPQYRIAAADACGFTNTHRDLLVDLGMFYLESGSSTPRSQRALYDIAASIPAELQVVEVVTQREYFAGASDPDIGIDSRAVVNVVSRVGGYSEGFPPEVPQARIDGFSVVVAHELNHNVEHAAGRLYPWFWDRKFDLLKQAAPPDLLFRDDSVSGFGLDLAATQDRFRAAGYWDGVADNWGVAYDAYWKTGPGAECERHWIRDNLRDCIDNPQEAFATLSNQYFTSSDMMLQLAKSRWDEGIETCINQFLFFADVYSLGTNETFFYRIDTEAHVTRRVVPIMRDLQGHIHSLAVSDSIYEFSLDSAGNVQEWLH